jgi:glycosyltransferase involved in cell wall biosynthesis
VETGPLVSICIPVYNAASYLEDCLRSITEQSYKNIEVIAIDNGSTDESLDIITNYKGQNIITGREPGKGAAKARNKALKLAKGKYIQFLDADDLLSADKITKQVSALEAEPGKLAVCSTIYFFDNNLADNIGPTEYDEQFLYDTNDPVSFMINLWGGNTFKANMVQPNAWLTPMELIARNGLWNETLTLDDDGEFFARMVLNSAGVVKTGGFNYYRKHRKSFNNLSSQQSRPALQSAFQAILLKKQALFYHTRSEPAKKAIYKQLKELAIRCYHYYPELYQEIDKELREFDNYEFLPLMGGRLINLISKNFGWKMARRIQLLINS